MPTEVELLEDILGTIVDYPYGDPIVDETYPHIAYIGWAAPGTRTNVAEWKVCKITTDCVIPAGYPTDHITEIGNGKQTITEWAAGQQDFIHAWSDRTSLDYYR